MAHPLIDLVQSHTRRAFLTRSVGAAALASLLGNDAAAELPQAAPKAKRIIYLFQSGAPSQLDLFDYKPQLIELNGKPMPESFTKGQRIAQLAGQKLTCVGSKFKFQKHGKSGAEISELLPNISGIADEIAIIRSMH